MEIEELTMEQAKEMFYSEKGQQAWKVITQLVGPPVEYAFKDDYIMRLYLTAAFSGMFIRRDRTVAEDSLEYLKKGCTTKFDKAVWALAAGTFPEVFGNRQEAVNFYEDAIDKYAGTYVAYFRMAKIAYDTEDFGAAEKYCRQGLSYLSKDELCERNLLKGIEVQFVDFLDKILKKLQQKKDSGSSVAENGPKVVALEDIWKMEDSADFVIALGEYINQKCEYGSKLSALSKEELVFYITQSVEANVNSDGFEHVLFYMEEECIGQIVQSFVAIGAVKTAEICKRALSAYGQTLPQNMTERQNLIVELEEAGFAEADEILNECDGALYQYEEDLNALNHAYVLKNKVYFT